MRSTGSIEFLESEESFEIFLFPTPRFFIVGKLPFIFQEGSGVNGATLALRVGDSVQFM